MPKRGRVKGAYTYARRRDGTKYRVYHTKGYGKYSKGTGAYRKSYTGPRTKRQRMSGGSSAMQGVIHGFGAYRAGRGTIRSGNQVPAVVNSKGGFILRHKEFIGDIPASQAFLLASLSINPGQSATFPWLSQIAENFEEWVPRGIIFEYKTTSSNAVVSTNANAALGTVVMATEYNVANPPFGNKQQMENYEGAVSTDPSRTLIHYVETKRTQNPLGVYFVRTGAQPANTDLRFYDLGLFQIATVGMQGTGTSNPNNIGELWVSYEIELRKPRILTGQPLANEPAADHFQFFAAGVTTIDTTVLPAVPFGTITTALRFPTTKSNLGGVMSGGIVLKAAQPNGGIIPALDGSGNATGLLADSTANTYYFPPGLTSGVYMIQYVARYTTGGTATWAPTIVPTNCTATPLLENDGVSIENNLGTAAVTTAMFTAFLTITTKGNARFSVTGTTGTFATPLFGDMIVTQLPTGMN